VGGPARRESAREPGHARAARSNRRTTVLVSLGLLLATATLYAPALGHAFIGFDDRGFLVENRALDAGLSREGVAWAFETRLDGNWIPLTWLSFLADQEIHGLSASGTHATNVALHALAAVLLFLALARLSARTWPSAFVAALFALHPLHVESVAWAIERKDVLSGVFFAATLLAYARYARRPGFVGALAVFGLFALGLLAKPMLVTLPCVLLLLDAWPLGRLGSAAALRRALVEKIPMAVLAALVSAITIRAQSAAGAGESMALALPARLANAVVSYATYLRKAVAPVDLALFYPHPGAQLAAGTLAGSAAVLLAISIVAAWQWRKRPYVAVGWLWYLGMLVPVSGLVQVGAQAMADRYTYLPLVGATLPIAFAGAECARKGRLARGAVVAAALAALLACGLVSRRQLAHWRDGESVMAHALAVTQRNAVAHNGLAVELLARGRIAAARRELQAAVSIDPDLPDAQVNLGVALLKGGDPEGALPHLRRGLGLDPRRRAQVYAQLAAAELAAGRPERALAEARRGLALRDLGALHAAAGVALVSQGDEGAGERELRRAEALGVDDPGLHASLARVLERRGDARAAVERYRRALARTPEDPALANNLAWLLATAEPGVRDAAEAVRLAEAAVARRPVDPDVLDTLAVAYHAAGQIEAALAASRRAAEAARAAGRLDQAAAFEARAAAWAGRKGGPASGP